MNRKTVLKVKTPMDFDPIELAFSQLRTHLRAAGSRSNELLIVAIGVRLGAFRETDAATWFRHCGYHFPSNDLPQPL